MSAPSPSTPPPSSGNPFAPQEPPLVLFLERMSFAGNNMGEIFYGITLILFFQCMRALLGRSSPDNMRQTVLLTTYVFVMFALGTIFTAMNVHLQQFSYVDNRNFHIDVPGFPEGPVGYSLFMQSQWRGIVPNACYIISNWLADGLLMFRCYILYKRQKAVIVFPMIMFLGSISLGVITLYKSSRPGSNLWSGLTVNFGLPYFTLSVSLNIILTILLSVRLLIHNSKAQGVIQGTRSASLYTRIVTILVESCALYALFSILFIGTYAAGNYASDLFLPILSQVQIISPYLVILRVATKTSVEHTTMAGSAETGQIQFKRGQSHGTNGTTTLDATNFPLKSMDHSTHSLDKKAYEA